MESVVKADIFFIVSTVAVVAVTIFLIIAMVYLISILRDARKLSSRVRQEGEEIVNGVGVLRKKGFSRLAKFINSFNNKNKN